MAIKYLLGKPDSSNTKFRLIGGAVGYISYDMVRYYEKIPTSSRDEIRYPDYQMGIYTDGIVYDHRNERAYYYCRAHDRFDQIAETLSDHVEARPLSSSIIGTSMKRDDFEEAVQAAKSYITSGDIFQVVLSKRLHVEFTGDLIDFYRLLRKINPSPYMYFLKFRSRAVIGSSPEMLVRVEKRKIETYPIAGTRPVTTDDVRNRKLGEEMVADRKERAEHIMLVDLARNDLGRVSQFGTVTVQELMKVRRFSHVQHMVSRVVSNLRPGYTAYDALRAVFPAGTVTGAPKPRAMEIIDELERTRRGPYAGSVGYFSFNGSADFAITIRTLVAQGSRAFIQAGAGIVADSKPEREWMETEHKAEALLHAFRLGVSNQG